MTDCFHCGEPVPAGVTLTVAIDGTAQPVCCAGCQAVATLIADTGLTPFYRFRDAPAPTPETATVDPAPWTYLDPLAERWLSHDADGTAQISLSIGNLRCTACGWLIEQTLGAHPAVAEIRVNPASGRAEVRFDPARLPLSELLARIAALGYRPAPADSDDAWAQLRAERRGHLKRLALAGIGMMQVMMYAAGLYLGAFEGMDPVFRQYLWWVSMLVATPVVFYSGAPFFASAWRGLKAGKPGMDLPVSLAIGTAWGVSTVSTFTGHGEVWFDSATMFVFFLTLARFLEFGARQKAADALARLADQTPETARKLLDGRETVVAASELQRGDRIRVVAGEPVPADGRILDGCLSLDESLLTGEAEPQSRRSGDTVTGGTVCLNGSADVEVLRSLGEGVLSGIRRLVARAQSDRPPLARLADRIAGRFVLGVLAVALLAGLGWWWLAPHEALRVVLAVLVVTCPCALSLATPVALAAATARLARQGLLITGARALEQLAHADTVVFDKTGTLTRGRPGLRQIRCLTDWDADTARRYAAALEAHSSHPLARAFAGIEPIGEAEEVRNVPGQGIEGRVAGRWLKLGRPSFAAPRDTLRLAIAEGWVVLGDGEHTLAAFEIHDDLRPDAACTVDRLRNAGLDVQLLSGDAEQPVAQLAGQLGIGVWRARQTPDDKLAEIRALQAAGHTVAAVGDGSNDGPLLAGADVGIALGEGAALAQHSADVVLTGSRLGRLLDGIDTARQALRVIRQNLLWAVLYNLVALPLAVSGGLAPWMAAIGMSASSLLVTGNALRLQYAGRESEDDAQQASRMRPEEAAL